MFRFLHVFKRCFWVLGIVILAATATWADDENITEGFNAKKFELAPETYYYHYSEVIGVKLKGVKYGLTGTYVDHFHENQKIDSFSDIFTKNSLFTVFKVEMRSSYGKLDYEGTGTVSNVPDYNFEGRLSAGFDIPISQRLRITPYLGYGFRYLYNQLSVAPATVIDGFEFLSGYDRVSKYHYLPISAEVEIKMDQGWSAKFIGEYDYFLYGMQNSHFQDQKNLNGESLGYDPLKNQQKRGMGLRLSSRLQKENPRMDLFLDGFIRYWHIRNSKVAFQTINGAYICNSEMLCLAGQEPDNKTWEIGTSVGIKF